MARPGSITRVLVTLVTASLVFTAVSPPLSYAASRLEHTSALDPLNSWVASVAIDETNPTTVYASTAYLTDPPGDFYRSRDRGDSWTGLSRFVPWAVSGGNAALKTDGSTIYAGTYAGTRGIFRGTREGTSWTPLVTWTTDEKVTDIEIDPNDRSRVFAVTEFWGNQQPNLRFSLDSGSAWSARPIVVEDAETFGATSIVIGPGGRLIVGCTSPWRAGHAGGGVYVSDDMGASWRRPSLQDLTVIDLAVDPSNRNVVYAVAGHNEDYFQRLFRSTDAGESFSELDLPPDTTARTVDVDSRGRVFAGVLVERSAGGLAQSDDAGLTWSLIGDPVPGQLLHASALDPSGCLLYLGGYQGISRYWVGAAEEIAGADRYRTAIEVSKTRFPASDSAAAVVIVSGLNFPDAVVAGPLAVQRDGVILLSGAQGLDATTMSELDRVLPTGGTVTIIGGHLAVPAAVDATLTQRGYTVERIAGADRYETSAKVAQELGEAQSFFVANGSAFPDALSASAPAAQHGMPILLVNRDAIPPTVAAHLSQLEPVARGYIAGDASVVSDGVASQLGSFAETITRLGGADRYQTSLLIAEEFHPAPSAVGIATGTAFPDGLTGAVLLAQRQGPLLLTRPGTLPEATGQYLSQSRPAQVTVFGGRNAVSVEARCQLEGLW